MARRGTSKRKSRDQEDHVARLYDGAVSASSGAAVNDGGDVRAEWSLIECKATGNPGDPKRPSVNQILKWLAGIYAEAAEEGRDPVLALRLYAPDHPLAGHDGWVDLAIRPLGDDADRERAYAAR